MEYERIIHWLENIVPIMPTEEATTHNCPHCGKAIRYPLIVRQWDVDAFVALCGLADKYLKNHGATDQMLRELEQTIAQALAVKEAQAIMNLPNQSMEADARAGGGENDKSTPA